jgi:hypothetical protein
VAVCTAIGFCAGILSGSPLQAPNINTSAKIIDDVNGLDSIFFS